MSSYRGCGVDKLTDLTKLMSSCSGSNSHGREIVHLAIGSLGQTNCWLFGLGLQGHTIQLGIITRCHNFFWNPCKSMSPIFWTLLTSFTFVQVSWLFLLTVIPRLLVNWWYPVLSTPDLKGKVWLAGMLARWWRSRVFQAYGRCWCHLGCSLI